MVLCRHWLRRHGVDIAKMVLVGAGIVAASTMGEVGFQLLVEGAARGLSGSCSA